MTPAADPVASVVIATHNRVVHLERLLDALAKQTCPGAFEVVVVDDASSDGTAVACERRRGLDPFELVVLRQDTNTGPAAARNRGWRAARGEVVCFTDDDCVPQTGWLEVLVGAVAESDIAQGKTQPRPDQLDEWRPFSVTVERLREDGFYETCNIAYRRSVLEQAGGFDESFRFPYGEDTDLAWRARAAGATTRFVPDALVYHEVWPFRWSRYVRDLQRREGMVLLVAKHPQLRALFRGGWYQRPTHPAAVVAATALLAAASAPRARPRLLAAGAAVAAYYEICRHNRRNPPRRRHWAHVLPAALANDLAEVAVFAVASVRHRTLFL